MENKLRNTDVNTHSFSTPNTKHINTYRYHLHIYMNVNVHMCTHVAPPALSVVHVDKMMYVCVVPGKVMNKK